MVVGTKNGRAKKDAGTNRISVTVPALNVGKLTLDLVGTSPLVTHNFDEKSRQEMLDKQTKKGSKGREARCPDEEFLGALYWVEGERPKANVDKETGQKTFDAKAVKAALKKGVFGIPATGLKNALISAARNVDGVSMTALKQAVFVSGEKYPDWAIIKSSDVPDIDRRIVRLAGSAKTPMERFRPRWDQWETTIKVEFDRNVFSAEEIVNLINIAGHYVGVCEGRPEKSALGWGRFSIK